MPINIPGDARPGQSLSEHLENVATLAERFAAVFGSSQIARTAGLLHDLGKADPRFQSYLSIEQDDETIKTRCEINHSEAGAFFVEKEPEMESDPLFGRTLSYIIAGHHAGLPDAQDEGKAALSFRLQRGGSAEDNFGAVYKYLPQLLPELKLDDLDVSFDLSVKNYHFWTRFLFSCLVDADRLDAEKSQDPVQAKKREDFQSARELKDVFDAFALQLAQKRTSAASEYQRTLQTARDAVLEACRTAGRSDASGVFKLSVPTGGGKTLSSMAFALERVVKANRTRVIYVAPFTTILDQTAKVFADIFGRKNVVEHHCNLDRTYKTKGNASEDRDLDYDENKWEPQLIEKLDLAAENWDAPIVVTTNVQFFESLFAAKPNRCRKLHNIANSVVILDEAQGLPGTFLSPCVDALNALAQDFNVDVVLCTATQPALNGLGSIKTQNKKYSQLDEPTPIIPQELETRLFAELSRVRYEFDDPKVPRDWDELAEELAQNKEVLCVVNTRKDCRELYDALCARVEKNAETNESEREARTICLSALCCGAHRAKILEEIKTRLDENRKSDKKTPLRVIATQLVEAGVDIDFPVAYRALAGLDSIAQAAGRCNREGKLGRQGGRVVVFTPPHGAPNGELSKGENATREMLSANPKLEMEDQKTFEGYFERFYYSLNSLDEKKILEQATKDVNNPEQRPNVPFRSIGEDFKLIEDESISTIVQYGDSPKLIERLKRVGPKAEIMRELQRYAIATPLYVAQSLIEDGVIQEIYPGIFVQSLPGYYQENVGFDVFRTTMPEDSLFV